MIPEPVVSRSDYDGDWNAAHAAAKARAAELNKGES